MRFLSSRWFKVVVSLGLFGILLHSTDTNALWKQFVAVRLDVLAAAFVGYLMSQALSAYKWQVLARPLGFVQPFRTFLVYYFVGMYLNLLAPSTIVGDVGRSLFLAENRKRLGAALHSVVTDRVSGLAMLLWVSASGFLVFGPTVLPPILCYGIIVAAIALPIAWWIISRVVTFVHFSQPLLQRFVEKLILPYQKNAITLGYACILSYVFHWFQLSLQVLLAYALNLPVPLWYLMLFIPLVHILSALPVSFGGIGVREGGYVAFLALIGVGKDQALAFGVLWSVLVLAAGAIGGVMMAFSSQARLRLAEKSRG